MCIALAGCAERPARCYSVMRVQRMDREMAAKATGWRFMRGAHYRCYVDLATSKEEWEAEEGVNDAPHAA